MELPPHGSANLSLSLQFDFFGSVCVCVSERAAASRNMTLTIDEVAKMTDIVHAAGLTGLGICFEVFRGCSVRPLLNFLSQCSDLLECACAGHCP